MRTFLSLFINFNQRRLRAGWRILIQFVLFIFLMISAGLAFWFLNLDDEITLFFGAGLQQLVMLISVMAAGFLIDRRQLTSFGFARKVWLDRLWLFDLAIGFSLGAIAMIWIFGTEYLLGWITVKRVGLTVDIPLRNFLTHQIAFLLLLILVGISEELFSRGYHLKNMSEGFRRLGNVPAVILAVLISSAIFGLLHAANDNATWTSNVGVALAGIMLGTARVTTGSLAAPIGLHISWNLFQGPVLGFPVSGNGFRDSWIELVQGGDPVWTGGPFGPEAGLIGCLATIALTLAFVVWGFTKSEMKRSTSALTHFRRVRKPERLADPILATLVQENRESENRKSESGASEP